MVHRPNIAVVAFVFVLGACAAAAEGDSSWASGMAAGAGGGGDTGASSGSSSGPGAPNLGDFAVETCSNPPTLAPESVATCGVVPGDERILVVGELLTPGRVIEQGGVLIEPNGAIGCVGCDCAAAAAGATMVICPDAVVSPGLVNAHDHVGWMNGRPWSAEDAGVDPALRWEQRHDWRKGKRGHPVIKVSGGNASRNEKIWGELRMVLGGATAIFGSGDLGGLLRDLDATGSGSSGLGRPGAEYETFPLGDSSGTQSAEGCEAFNVTAPPSEGAARVASHVSEGIDREARNEFHCLTGVGAGSGDVLGPRSAVVHGVGLGAVEVEEMAKRSVSLVWSPRSNVSLYGATAPVTLMRAAGIPIGLGTDWLPSGSMNMLRELACAAELNDGFYGGAFSEHELWQMATLGSARALGFDDALGVLVAGHQGDVAVFRKRGREHFGAVVRASVEDVALVLRAGKPLSGDANVVAALETGCEALDVCGVSKAVCVSRDTGVSLTSVAATQPPYPLFFCGLPEDEPTCLPARTLAEDVVMGSTSYAGVSTASDRDGDGLDDDDDLCPTVFDPVRPIDGGAQADADADGLGDACDPCPLEAGDGCSPKSPYDPDGDGIPSFSDVCPETPDPAQADADADGLGDACDPCPTAPNPGGGACPGEQTTIFALQDATHPAHPMLGERVRVGCVVTGFGPTGAFCQDPKGGAYSGIFVYAAGSPVYAGGEPVYPGDLVTVDGDYEEYKGATELTNPVFTFVSKASLPAPVVVSPSDIATGGVSADPLQGVLVTVQGVTVVNSNPDAPNDYDELLVSGNLRVDDLLMDNTLGGLFDNASFPAGTAFSSITGLVHFSFGESKLLPRKPADLVK